MEQEYKYKTDLHCHTAEASSCSSEGGADTVEKYIKCGYSSVVITNHFSPNHFRNFGGTYESFVDRYFGAVETAREAAAGRINVLYGLELKTGDSFDDFLVYGVDREMMLSFPDIFECDLSKFYPYFSERGCLVIQAHPMRFGITLNDPRWLDGYEVINTHTEWDSHNDIAAVWAREVGGPGKILTAGTDHHDAQNIPSSGILTKEPVTSNSRLVEILRSGDYTLFEEQR